MQPIDNRKGVIWMDGQFVNWSDAKIHVLTHGLHYGSSVFEGIRVYHKKPFKITEHLNRLINSANLLGMKIDYNTAQLSAFCNELVIKNDMTNCYIRPFIWRGSENLRVGAYNTVHIAIACWETGEDLRVPIENKEMYKLTLSNWRKAPQNVFPAVCKGAGAYVMNTVAKHQAEIAGFNDALILDMNDNIAEATTSNIFMVKDGKLITPSSDQILDGFTRKTVIEIAKENNIIVDEKFFSYQELLKADEVFLTGTTIEILPVCQIDDTKFKLGNVTKLLANKFFELVDNI